MLPIHYNTQNWLPEVFNDLFNTNWMTPARATAPAINVTEDEKAYHVEVAAPGMVKEDFNISLDANEDLVISMEKKDHDEVKDDEKKNVRYLRREFHYSKYQQTLVLPENTDKDHISAKMEHGVLTIDLPKLDEQQKQQLSRNIRIA